MEGLPTQNNEEEAGSPATESVIKLVGLGDRVTVRHRRGESQGHSPAVSRDADPLHGHRGSWLLAGRLMPIQQVWLGPSTCISDALPGGTCCWCGSYTVCSVIPALNRLEERGAQTRVSVYSRQGKDWAGKGDPQPCPCPVTTLPSAPLSSPPLLSACEPSPSTVFKNLSYQEALGFRCLICPTRAERYESQIHRLNAREALTICLLCSSGFRVGQGWWHGR